MRRRGPKASQILPSAQAVRFPPSLAGWGDFFGAPSMGVLLRVQVPSQVDHNERSEAQLREGNRVWEGSVERKLRADEQESDRRHCQAGRVGQRP